MNSKSNAEVKMRLVYTLFNTYILLLFLSGGRLFIPSA